MEVLKMRTKKRTRRSSGKVRAETLRLARSICLRSGYSLKETTHFTDKLEKDAEKTSWSRVLYHVKKYHETGFKLSHPKIPDASHAKYGFNKPKTGTAITGPDWPGCINSGMAWMLGTTKLNDGKVVYFVCRQLVDWYCRVWNEVRIKAAMKYRSFEVRIDDKRKEQVKIFVSYDAAANYFISKNKEIQEERKRNSEERKELTEKAKSGHPDDITNLAFHMLDNG